MQSLITGRRKPSTRISKSPRKSPKKAIVKHCRRYESQLTSEVIHEKQLKEEKHLEKSKKSPKSFVNPTYDPPEGSLKKPKKKPESTISQDKTKEVKSTSPHKKIDNTNASKKMTKVSKEPKKVKPKIRRLESKFESTVIFAKKIFFKCLFFQIILKFRSFERNRRRKNGRKSQKRSRLEKSSMSRFPNF